MDDFELIVSRVQQPLDTFTATAPTPVISPVPKRGRSPALGQCGAGAVPESQPSGGGGAPACPAGEFGLHATLDEAFVAPVASTHLSSGLD